MNKYAALLLLLSLLCSFPAVSLLAKEDLFVEKGRTVKFHYVLKSEGKVVDSSKKKIPLEIEFGKEALSPAFEKNILGMKAGDKKKFDLAPEDAFGPWHAANTRVFHRSELPDRKLKPGMLLTASHPATAETLTGRISKIIGDKVGIDFNHSLAGKTLQAEVKVLEVR
jgi:FKBP-type peptidyl-prolyl cis-trans isomerase SlpA